MMTTVGRIFVVRGHDDNYCGNRHHRDRRDCCPGPAAACPDRIVGSSRQMCGPRPRTSAPPGAHAAPTRSSRDLLLIQAEVRQRRVAVPLMKRVPPPSRALEVARRATLPYRWRLGVHRLAAELHLRVGVGWVGLGQVGSGPAASSRLPCTGAAPRAQHLAAGRAGIEAAAGRNSSGRVVVLHARQRGLKAVDGQCGCHRL